MKRIVVLISGSGSNLQALIDQFHQGIRHASLLLSPIKQTCMA